MNYLLSVVATVLVFGVSYELTVQDAATLCREATVELTRLENDLDAQLIKAATLQWRLDGNTGTPTTKQLVDAQLLDSAYLTRERAADRLKECSAIN